jgi:hypothetical protein
MRWAIYLGVSWTWCIGMFLPTLLVRDFGLWSFLAFALPNVLGAAAMGLVLKDAAASREMVARHRGAMISFSRVTIAYQCFFAGWMLPQLLGWFALLLYPLIVLSLVAAIKRDREFSLITLLTFAVSVAAWITLEARGLLSFPAPAGLDGAALLAPVCLLGFLLCPYLDLTFHHAFQRAAEKSTAPARLAFILGFGVVFASMIVLTLRYTNALSNPAAHWLIGTHILVQLSATILLHQVRSAKESGKPNGLPLLPVVGLFSAIGVGAFLTPPIANWQAGEYLYRAFLAFYGLLVPLYVLLRIVPKTPAHWRLLGGAAITALPFYVVGFYTSHTWALAGGVGVVLLAWTLSGIAPKLPLPTPPPNSRPNATPPK